LALHLDLEAGESVTVNNVRITLEYKSGRKASFKIEELTKHDDDGDEPESTPPGFERPGRHAGAAQ